MRKVTGCLVVLVLAAGFDTTAQTPVAAVQMAGVSQPVEILRDRWGINHIYAQNEPDLFFAQGYAAARDRLFQFEVWRRQATGTIGESASRLSGRTAIRRFRTSPLER